MRAVVFREHGGPEVLKVEAMPEPTVGPGDVLIRVRAVTVNRTLDCDVRQRGANWPIPMPHILGPDPAGDVVAVGSHVTGITVGDRVVTVFTLSDGTCPMCVQGLENACDRQQVVGVHVNGGDAELVSVPARNVLSIPQGMSYVDAASIMMPFSTAWHLLVDRGGVRAAETVLVMAAGGAVGVAGVQIAKLAGARVIAAAGADWKLEKACGLGADAGVNYNTSKLSEEVLRLTNGRGADVVFENISSPDLWPESLASLATRGRLLTCGSHGGGIVQTNVRAFYRKHHAILSSASAPRRTMELVYRLAAAGRLRPVIHTALPLEEARKAHEIIEGREQFGRVVLTIS